MGAMRLMPRAGATVAPASLPCAPANKNRGQRRNQYIEVKPERPVADVEAILGALNAEITVASR